MVHFVSPALDVAVTVSHKHRCWAADIRAYPGLVLAPWPVRRPIAL